MRKMMIYLLAVTVSVVCVGTAAYCFDGGRRTKQTLFDKILSETPEKDGVRQITYAQFADLQDSDSKYFLLDVLPPERYNKGHIEGAVSFPLNTINKESAASVLPPGARVIVYCANFTCPASTKAARKLSGYGYKVFDYKGGLQEWQEKGHGLLE